MRQRGNLPVYQDYTETWWWKTFIVLFVIGCLSGFVYWYSCFGFYIGSDCTYLPTGEHVIVEATFRSYPVTYLIERDNGTTMVVFRYELARQ